MDVLRTQLCNAFGLNPEIVKGDDQVFTMVSPGIPVDYQVFKRASPLIRGLYESQLFNLHVPFRTIAQPDGSLVNDRFLQATNSIFVKPDEALAKMQDMLIQHNRNNPDTLINYIQCHEELTQKKKEFSKTKSEARKESAREAKDLALARNKGRVLMDENGDIIREHDYDEWHNINAPAYKAAIEAHQLQTDFSIPKNKVELMSCILAAREASVLKETKFQMDYSTIHLDETKGGDYQVAKGDPFWWESLSPDLSLPSVAPDPKFRLDLLYARWEGIKTLVIQIKSLSSTITDKSGELTKVLTSIEKLTAEYDEKIKLKKTAADEMSATTVGAICKVAQMIATNGTSVLAEAAIGAVLDKTSGKTDDEKKTTKEAVIKQSTDLAGSLIKANSALLNTTNDLVEAKTALLEAKNAKNMLEADQQRYTQVASMLTNLQDQIADIDAQIQACPADSDYRVKMMDASKDYNTDCAEVEAEIKATEAKAPNNEAEKEAQTKKLSELKEKLNTVPSAISRLNPDTITGGWTKFQVGCDMSQAKSANCANSSNSSSTNGKAFIFWNSSSSETKKSDNQQSQTAASTAKYEISGFYRRVQIYRPWLKPRVFANDRLLKLGATSPTHTGWADDSSISEGIFPSYTTAAILVKNCRIVVSTTSSISDTSSSSMSETEARHSASWFTSSSASSATSHTESSTDNQTESQTIVLEFPEPQIIGFMNQLAPNTSHIKTLDNDLLQGIMKTLTGETAK